MRKTKLCYILPEYNPQTGTHFYHLYELLERAADKLAIFVIIEKLADHVDPQDLRNLPFDFYIQKFSFPPLRYLELGWMVCLRRLKGAKNFYTHYSYYGGLITRLTTLMLGGRAYYWNCGMLWDYKRGVFEEAVLRYILKNTILVTGTKSMKKEYARHYGLKEKNIKVLPNWINLERFQIDFGSKAEIRKKLNLPQDKKIILFVHHLSKRKGADLLPQIAEQFKDRKDILFVIVGDGHGRQDLEFGIRNYELADIVRIEGLQPNSKIPLYFNAADIFIMPSREEGFPRVILEAMATATPFVSSDVGGTRDIIPEYAEELLCEAGEVHCFANAIKKLLSSEEIYNAFQLAETEHVRQYDLVRVAEDFVSLIQEQGR